ncbi:NAD-dependent epimerase/dehydratase family protein [Chitinophaga niabensis]|uniref:Nucleoside-diphosphate-sugar epimerase n=1 Tax=Chitinophaga niabensis TaxID=536979 RepID=A0A1N6JXU4_9BACT|nr:NAD-dependent epimerase/dehydratase family protein [Chitinophaga niabensis]SIO49041.1 Nucleoside-diphosphate-sugar epimerase [Chitinophaga niabensis]
MKIVITGASGFVGQNLQNYLSAHASYDIITVGRSPQPNTPNYLSFAELLQTNDASADAIVHLAGKAHDLRNVSDPSEYFKVNYELTKQLFDKFLLSSAGKFIYVSSVKAVADLPQGTLTEDTVPAPKTAYGQSKLKAEEYLRAQTLPGNKQLYILRPCMIHGPGNKGNLNLLASVVKKNIPYPFGAFENQRSFLSIDNLCYIIQEILAKNIPSGTYNVADDQSLSTNELIALISQSFQKHTKIWNINKSMVRFIANVGDKLGLPVNNEMLQKLTTDYVVSNKKLLSVLDKPLPLSSTEGLLKTLRSIH